MATTTPPALIDPRPRHHRRHQQSDLATVTDSPAPSGLLRVLAAVLVVGAVLVSAVLVSAVLVSAVLVGAVLVGAVRVGAVRVGAVAGVVLVGAVLGFATDELSSGWAPQRAAGPGTAGSLEVSVVGPTAGS